MKSFLRIYAVAGALPILIGTLYELFRTGNIAAPLRTQPENLSAGLVLFMVTWLASVVISGALDEVDNWK